jgi:hypothetical protein
MKNMVQINVKLAQLYDTRYVNEPENGEKRLVEAVESVLREKQRREKEGVKSGEGPWLTDDETGATLEGRRALFEACGTSADHDSPWDTLRAIRLSLPSNTPLRQGAGAQLDQAMP